MTILENIHKKTHNGLSRIFSLHPWTFTIHSMEVEFNPRKLRAQWEPAIIQYLTTYYNIDIENEMIEMLTNEFIKNLKNEN